MNLLQKIRILEKFRRTIVRRTIASASVTRWRNGPLPVLSLQSRMLNFLEHLDSTNDDGKNSIKKLYMPTTVKPEKKISSRSRPATSVKDNSDYEALVKTIETQLLSSRSSPLRNDLEAIDQRCCKVLGRSLQSQIFSLLRLLTRALPNEILSLKFYKNALLALRKMLEAGNLEQPEILQLLFFESWNQKLAVRNVKFILSHVPPLSELSYIEQSIVAQSSFKCAIPLEIEDVRVLQNTVENHASCLIKDKAILSTFCKAIRLAGPTEECRLDNLSQAILDQKERISLMTTAHVLSLYAEAGIQSSDVLRRLFKDAIETILMNEANVAYIRNKDVNRVLWASSMMSYELVDHEAATISSFLDRKYEDLKTDPYCLANILLSLWILDRRELTILKRSLAEQVFLPIVQQKRMWKARARLHLLLSCVKIEAPEIELPEKLSEPYKVGLKISPSVMELRESIDGLMRTRGMQIEDIKIDCPIDGLYIAGVSFKHKKSDVHVDLLNDTNCFKGTTTTRGFMNLKLRLLSKTGVRSISIPEAQLSKPKTLRATLKKCILDSS